MYVYSIYSATRKRQKMPKMAPANNYADESTAEVPYSHNMENINKVQVSNAQYLLGMLKT